jgi:hypothetical protein
MPRPRANSLTIYISVAHKWRATRPPTPRRQTFPGANKPSSSGPTYTIPRTNITTDTDIPPVPPLSYFEPDTPVESLASPMLLSSCKDLLVTFSPTSPRKQVFSRFSPASPNLYLPTSPSIYSSISPNRHVYTYLHPITSLSPIHLFSCIPSCEPSPMSPRFLFPRTPPLPPQSSCQTKLRSQTLFQNEDDNSPTSFCFGMRGRRQSTPCTSSPRILCGSAVMSDASRQSAISRNTLGEGETPQKLGWSSINSPVRLYFEKMEGDKGRKKALRMRRFEIVKESEGMRVDIAV